MANNQTQLLVLDMQLLELKSTELNEATDLEMLIKRYPLVKMIILYEQVDINLFRWMFHIGITGILGKSADLDDFQGCMKKVYKNEIFVENKIFIDFINSPQTISRNGKENPKSANLTKRERLVANLLIEGKNNAKICAILQLQPSTVSTFKQNVFRKLQVSSLLELEKFKTIAN